MFSGRKELGGETTRDESEHRGDHGQSATFSRVGFGINPAGVIAGEYADASFVFHGFVRAANGTITTFDAPGAGTGPGQSTEAFGINYAGTIEGVFADSSNVFHGFVRAANGVITTFDPPGAGTGPG